MASRFCANLKEKYKQDRNIYAASLSRQLDPW